MGSCVLNPAGVYLKEPVFDREEMNESLAAKPRPELDEHALKMLTERYGLELDMMEGLLEDLGT